MKNSELDDKLNRLFKLKSIIETKVRNIYEEHNALTVELAEEFCRRKGGENGSGILKSPLTLIVSGIKYQLVPSYMKNGQLSNVIWKPCGVHAFTINRVLKENEEK